METHRHRTLYKNHVENGLKTVMIWRRIKLTAKVICETLWSVFTTLFSSSRHSAIIATVHFLARRNHNLSIRNLCHVAHVLVPLHVHLSAQNTSCGSLIQSFFDSAGAEILLYTLLNHPRLETQVLICPGDQQEAFTVLSLQNNVRWTQTYKTLITPLIIVLLFISKRNDSTCVNVCSLQWFITGCRV